MPATLPRCSSPFPSHQKTPPPETCHPKLAQHSKRIRDPSPPRNPPLPKHSKRDLARANRPGPPAESGIRTSCPSHPASPSKSLAQHCCCLLAHCVPPSRSRAAPGRRAGAKPRVAGPGRVTYARARGKPMDRSTSSADPCLTVPGRCRRSLRGVTLLYRSSRAAMPRAGVAVPSVRSAAAHRQRLGAGGPGKTAGAVLPAPRAETDASWRGPGSSARAGGFCGTDLSPLCRGVPTLSRCSLLCPPPPGFSFPSCPGICNE